MSLDVRVRKGRVIGTTAIAKFIETDNVITSQLASEYPAIDKTRKEKKKKRAAPL